MLLTNCASCAAPLALKDKLCCSRCKTRYCSAECQRAHWKRGGHKKLCEETAEYGGAEKAHGILKVAAADEAAVSACANVPKGAKCHICGQKNHPSGRGSGLVRGCSCHGTEGFMHLVCLFDIAQDAFGTQRSWTRWTTCRCCEQEFHGVVRCALGWACWRAYLDTPDDELRARAMTEVGIGLMEIGKYEEAFKVLEAAIDVHINREAPLTRKEVANRLITQCHLATCCSTLGWRTGKISNTNPSDGLRMIFDWVLENDPTAGIRYLFAARLARCLLDQHLVEEALNLLIDETESAQEDLGEGHAITIELVFLLSQACYKFHFFGKDGYRAFLIDAINMCDKAQERAVRVLGDDHPLSRKIKAALKVAVNEQLDWTIDDFPRGLHMTAWIILNYC